MSFQSDFDLQKSIAFRERLEIALAKVATAVVGEAVGVLGATQHQKRHDLGVLVINDTQAYLGRFAKATVSAGTLSGVSTDGDIEFMVTSVWDDIAGVKISDTV